jgi:hypothetical protein
MFIIVEEVLSGGRLNECRACLIEIEIPFQNYPKTAMGTASKGNEEERASEEEGQWLCVCCFVVTHP